MKNLHPAPELSLPLDAVTETFAILAVKRAGKSNAAVVMAEEMYDARLPWTAIDPKGDWWGVRSAGDGKAPGLRVTVFGGLHADVPLEPTAGKLIAELVAERRITCVLDVSEMTKADQRRFLTAFAERLYKINREPMHLFCEEADEYIPQHVKGEAAVMVGAFETLVKRGGFRGIGVTMVTQRSASLNKDVLTQAGTLIAMRTPSQLDREKIEGWIKFHGASDKVMSEIGTLANGEAWVFSTTREPALQKIKFRRRRTFDSGATPKVGEKIRPPSVLADVDLDAIREAMAETIERAKLDDPKALRAELARLKAEVAKKPAPAVAAAPAKEKRVEVPVLKDGQLARAEKLMAKLETIASALMVPAGAIKQAIESTRAPAPAAPWQPQHHFKVGDLVAVPGRPLQRVTSVGPSKSRTAPTGDASGLGRGELKVLAAIAQHAAGVTREQLTVLTGYKRSSRDTYLQRLRAAGCTDDNGTIITATEAGTAALGSDFEPLPVGAALLAHWRSKLPQGELACLEVAVGDYPDAVNRDSISEITGYQRSSRDTYLQRLRSRQLITEPSRGQVRASDLLFDDDRRAHG